MCAACGASVPHEHAAAAGTCVGVDIAIETTSGRVRPHMRGGALTYTFTGFTGTIRITAAGVFCCRALPVRRDAARVCGCLSARIAGSHRARARVTAARVAHTRAGAELGKDDIAASLPRIVASTQVCTRASWALGSPVADSQCPWQPPGQAPPATPAPGGCQSDVDDDDDGVVMRGGLASGVPALDEGPCECRARSRGGGVATCAQRHRALVV